MPPKQIPAIWGMGNATSYQGCVVKSSRAEKRRSARGALSMMRQPRVGVKPQSGANKLPTKLPTVDAQQKRGLGKHALNFLDNTLLKGRVEH
jgi:hypothetical protein